MNYKNLIVIELYSGKLNYIFFKISKCDNKSEKIYNLLKVSIKTTYTKKN